MDRLTERVEDYVKIKGCKTIYGANERKNAPVSSAIARLAAYEDSGLTPDEVQALVEEQKNPPLTIEEMKDLLGEPVWVETEYGKGWDVLNYFGRNFICMVSHYSYNICDFGKTWTAYRHKKDG